jgi:transposase
MRKELKRKQVLAFVGRLRPTVVAMEACGGTHFLGRQIGMSGHQVRPLTSTRL